jgi:hypothetical protein
MNTDTTAHSQRDAAEAILAKSHADKIGETEIVHGVAYPNSPISVRLSAPLLERLDRIAAAQHRKRGNLIQHALWEFVRTHDTDG